MTPNYLLESYAVQRDAARPNANSFFEKPVTGKHTKKEFGRTSRGKSGFPSVPLESSFFRQQRNIHPFRQNSSLGRFCFSVVSILGARAANRSESSIKNDEDNFCNSRKLIKWLLAPAHRRRPGANSFFEKRVTGKHTKNEFGRTFRGKSGFPSGD